MNEPELCTHKPTLGSSASSHSNCRRRGDESLTISAPWTQFNPCRNVNSNGRWSFHSCVLGKTLKPFRPLYFQPLALSLQPLLAQPVDLALFDPFYPSSTPRV